MVFTIIFIYSRVFGSEQVSAKVVDLLTGIEPNHAEKCFNIKSSTIHGIGLRLEITVKSGDCR